MFDIPEGFKVENKTSTPKSQPKVEQSNSFQIPENFNVQTEISPQEAYNSLGNVHKAPTIADYKTPENSPVGKNTNWLQDIIQGQNDIAEEIYNPVKPGVDLLTNTVQRVGAGIGEFGENLISPIINQLTGKEINYYHDLKDRLDKEAEEIDDNSNAVINPTTITEAFVGLGYGTSLKSVTALEGLTQAALAKGSNVDKINTGLNTAGLVVTGGKLIEKIANRYIGKDRTLRKLYKTIDMDENQANVHFNDYSALVGKPVKDFTSTDKVNAIVQGSPEAKDILFNSVESDPANAKMLNDYYKKVTNNIENMLNSSSYQDSIAATKNLEKGIKNGYAELQDGLDQTPTAVKLPEDLKAIINKYTKTLELNAPEFSERVSRLLTDAGNVGDLFAVEKQIRTNINKVDKLGTDAAMNEAKTAIKNDMQNILLDAMPNKMKKSREILNNIYTMKKKADRKKINKLFLDDDIKQQDYKKLYQAMMSTEDVSSFDNFIDLFGSNSKSAQNFEHFIIDRLVQKNKDDWDILNLGKLVGNLDEVTFRTKEGKQLQKILNDFDNVFTNMKSTEAWKTEYMDKGGSKSEFWGQIKASIIGRVMANFLQYLPSNVARREYVIRKLPAYLEKGELPRNIQPQEAKGLETYKKLLGQSNRLIAEEINEQALKASEYEKWKQEQNSFASKTLPENTNVEVPSNQQVVEQVEGELIDDIPTNNNTPSAPDEIIDIEVNPSTQEVITTDGTIINMGELLRGQNLPDKYKLPAKIAAPIKSFFDMKYIIKKDPAIKKAKLNVAKAKGKDKKDGAKVRLARLLEYQKLRDSGMKPQEAHKKAQEINTYLGLGGIVGFNINDNGDLLIDIEDFLNDQQEY